MSDLNNCSFTGHLTKEAMMKTLPTGTQLCVFSIANNRGWGNNEKVLYVEVNLWGKRGESLCQYLIKGKLVAVSGEIEIQKWTSQQDGLERQKLVLNCNDIVLMPDGKGKSSIPTVEAEVVNNQRDYNF